MDWNDLILGAPFATILSASPWKYSANDAVIFAVILFHRNSSTHKYTNAAFSPSTFLIVSLYEVCAVCMSPSLC